MAFKYFSIYAASPGNMHEMADKMKTVYQIDTNFLPLNMLAAYPFQKILIQADML